MVICYPLKSKKFNSIGNIKTALLIIWISAFVLAIPLVKMSVVSVTNLTFFSEGNIASLNTFFLLQYIIRSILR